MKKLAIVTTHPIQYYAPLFVQLAKQNGIKIKVFYTWGEDSVQKHDPGFGKSISWDIPMLEGYDYEFLQNKAKNPGSHHRNGIINPDLISKITAFNPTAILLYGYAYQSHLKTLRHFSGNIPIWFRGDSNLLDEISGIKSVLKTLFLKWIYSKVDIAFYVGQNNKKYFKKYGLQEKQLIFAPHAIDNERFATSRTIEVQTLRKNLNIAIDEILIVFAGKLEPKKAPNLLLDAFLNSHAEKVHLLFVGNGVLEESLRLKVIQVKTNKEQRLSVKAQKVHFMDFQNQSQMPVIYQACDLFCLPSSGPGETWGLAINEAMATGNAILVSDKVGCAIDLVTVQNGAIFKAGDLTDLTEKLNHLCSNKNDLVKLGISSKDKIKNWDFKTQIESITALLNKE